MVVENKGDGPRHYAVRSRKGVNYTKGSNPKPINGEVIGYIYNGQFVPASERPGDDGPDSASYGSAALVRRESKDILDDLLNTMDIKDALLTYVAAFLKVTFPGVKSKRMSTMYTKSFVSVWHPGLQISSNVLTDLYRRLGMDGKIRTGFGLKRLEKVSGDSHLVIDGMLKEDNSTVNDLSGFSFKSRVKGVKDISIVYVYDLERKEILFSEVFPGGFIDAAAYSRFVRDNGITRGILITDKGFPPSKLEKEFREFPELHFLTPLKRNDPRIKNNKMMEFEGVLKDTKEGILYKKATIKGGRYLYSFRDPKKASLEEMAYLRKNGGGKTFDNGKFHKKQADFGTIVFLSDQDLTAEEAYSCYSDRWTIELVFRYFKNDLDIHTTDAQDDFTVIGEEFVNTIASSISCRLIRVFKETGLMEKESYGDIMEDLSGIWRKTDSSDVLPEREDGRWVHPYEYAMDTMVTLGLCKGKLKYPEKKKAPATDGSGPVEKRPRGRPRKNPVEADAPKRPRGRPRKNPVAEEVPKRPRG
ncbi:MAG: transposase, partial [archaeon]|nr:transposase [archaeon]